MLAGMLLLIDNLIYCKCFLNTHPENTHRGKSKACYDGTNKNRTSLTRRNIPYDLEMYKTFLRCSTDFVLNFDF